jgi:phospholipid/cholesterol/gamma-HCH transport system substrate-binding protein
MSESALSARSRALYSVLGASVMAGAVAAASLAALRGDPGGTEYTATFGKAGQGLDERSDVKVRGVAVGRVGSVDLAPDGKVRVRMRVDEGVRVPRDALARIDPVSIFGPKEISLDLGPAAQTGPYLDSGGTIARTKDPVEAADTAEPLHNVTRAVDPQDLATLVHTFSQGLNGQGPALHRTVSQGSRVISVAHANRLYIQSLINDIAGVGGALQNRGGTITGATRDFNALSAAVSGRPDKVGRLLDQAASLSTKVGTDLRGHGANLGRIVDETGRYTYVAASAGDDLLTLVDALNGFFGGLSGVINVRGPQGRTPASLRATFPLDGCKLVADICDVAPTRSATRP